MSKLLQFKEWLTIPETIDYLSKELGEQINESDLYQLALQKQITFSLITPDESNLNIVFFRKMNDYELETLNRVETQLIKCKEKNTSLNESDAVFYSRISKYDDKYYKHYYNIYHDTDIWLLRENKDLIKALYNNVLSNKNITSLPNSIMIETKDQDLIAKITLEDEQYNLPTNIILVIEKQNLSSFLKTLIHTTSEQKQTKETQEDKPLNIRERENILKILAIFLRYNHELQDISSLPKNKIADIIINLADQNDLPIPSKNTIVKFIDEVNSLIPTR